MALVQQGKKPGRNELVCQFGSQVVNDKQVTLI